MCFDRLSIHISNMVVSTVNLGGRGWTRTIDVGLTSAPGTLFVSILPHSPRKTCVAYYFPNGMNSKKASMAPCSASIAAT